MGILHIFYCLERVLAFIVVITQHVLSTAREADCEHH